MSVQNTKSLLASSSRIQVPWVKVTIGEYTFGVFSETGRKDYIAGTFDHFKIQYPNYIKSLSVKKINGQINTYTLTITYPVTIEDDPNFFEKVFASVSSTRKIVFSYGDISMPTYIYKNEEAIITRVSQGFNLETSTIIYTVSAVSAAAIQSDLSLTMIAPSGEVKPSDKIKELFKNNKSLQETFTGMSIATLAEFIAGDDAAVELESKKNISALEYINYLVGCMIPAGTAKGLSNEIYILTLYDDTIEDKAFRTNKNSGPYFRVTKTSALAEQGDAYELNIGYNNQTIVRSFSVESDESYSLFYEYQNKLHPNHYVTRIDNEGNYIKKYSPTAMQLGNDGDTHASDIVWWTKVTKYPIKATVVVQGLLRPAQLMQYIRLNVIFPGGKKHIASGLYIITQQEDRIDASGYNTTLQMTRIGGDLKP